MEFKKISNHALQVTLKESKMKLLVEFSKDGFIELKVVEGDNVMKFDRPGEYGVKAVHFIMLEEEAETYIGKPNILSVVDNSNISLVILANKYNLSKITIEKIPDANILLTPLTGDSHIKAITKKMQPEYSVFVKGLLDAEIDEKGIAAMQTELNFVDDAKPTNIVKLDERDFISEEDTLTTAYILE